MLISYNWIRELVKFNESVDTLAEKLTISGIGINSIKKLKDDYVYIAEITPNRPDLLSMIGIAREVACITGGKLVLPQIGAFQSDVKKDIDVKIQAKSACLRYNATLIRDAKIKVSDEKITRRLAALEVRPVNNVVDITNYCLFERGQPLHAFDYDKIENKEIIIRWAKKDERIIAIDGNEYKLDEDILVIADSRKPIAIAGIMGGIDTEIGMETKNILLECAHFDPLIIRRACRKLGLSSASSYRFERGICLESIPEAARRASLLIEESTQAKTSDNVDIINTKIKTKYVTLNQNELERIIGFSIPFKETKRILKDLGFKVKTSEERKLTLLIPPFRQDILREADLIEEVVRAYGYDKIPSTLVKVSSRQIKEYKSTPNVTESFKYKTKQMIRNILISCGLNEVISYSLIDKEDLKTLGFKSEDIIHIRNPLSREQAVLRPTLVAGLLSVIKWNLNRQIKDVSIFEMGKVFSAGHKTGIKEEEKVGICLCGNKFLNDWQIKPKLVTFFDLKGILESLFNTLGLTRYKFHHFNNQFFIKGQAAKVSLDNKDIAIMGKIDEDILRWFDIREVVYIAEIDIEKILPLLKITHKMESIPKYPHIVRDLALIVREELESQTIINKIKKIGRPLVTEVTLFDVYRGKQIPPGYKSLAYSIKYQSYKRTLIDDEVDKIQQEIQRILVEDLKAQIR